VALTGQGPPQARDDQHVLTEAAAALRVPVAECVATSCCLGQRSARIEKTISRRPKAGGITAEKLIEEAEKIGEVTVIVVETPGVEAGGYARTCRFSAPQS